jgi:hypothetical protein
VPIASEGTILAIYLYECTENGRVVEVVHDSEVVIRNWGELCFAAQIAIGETGFTSPVRKRMSPPTIMAPVGNSALKNLGFTKLVKRDEGIYENVTAVGSESKYMVSGDPDSVPAIGKKIRD